MSDAPADATSLRRQLLIFLSGSLIVMIVGAALITYWVALSAANGAYDRSLLDPVLDIADNIRNDGYGARVDLPQKALEALVYDQLDTVIYQVRSERDDIIDGAAELPAPPAISPGEHLFFDGRYRGTPIRVAALHAPNGFIVQVGETLNKRNRLVREILLAELVPTLLIGAASIALAWFGVARGLRPLAQMRAELLRRSPRDLRPIAKTGVPREIAPVVDAFNGLLGHLRDASTLQQRFLANAAHQLRTPACRSADAPRAADAPRLAWRCAIRASADAQRDRSRRPSGEPVARAGEGRERAGSRPAAGSHRPDGGRRCRGARLVLESDRAQDRPRISRSSRR